MMQTIRVHFNYPSFGSVMTGRSYSGGNYRFGFNGKENDDEVKGDGIQQDYGMRIYDPRLGRFLSVDPIFKDYPWYTPYQFAGNQTICAIDLDGLEELWVTNNCFAPYDLFGSDLFGSYIGDGNDRRFGDGGTYRTSGTAQINLNTFEEPQFTAGNTTSKYVRHFGPDASCKSPSRFVNTDYFASSDKSYFSAQMHIAGSDQVSLGGKYFGDIDTHVNISFEKDSEAPNLVKVRGLVTGDRFPANETILNDICGNQLVLGVSGPKGPNKDIGPYLNLPGDNKEFMQFFELTIIFNSDETFNSVIHDNKWYSLADWNKQFTDINPKDTKTSTVLKEDN
ncbi:MAG: hypothetical protein H6605_05255 [Flavobacteriales bacterium]|nr:hypothetical protein [Flavobacteriales bacterium]